MLKEESERDSRAAILPHFLPFLCKNTPSVRRECYQMLKDKIPFLPPCKGGKAATASLSRKGFLFPLISPLSFRRIPLCFLSFRKELSFTPTPLSLVGQSKARRADSFFIPKGFLSLPHPPFPRRRVANRRRSFGKRG